MRVTGRKRRHLRIFKRVRGDEKSPRLVIFRSNKHIYAQLINDDKGLVLIGCSTLMKEFKEHKLKSYTKDGAKELGKILAKRAIEKGIEKIRFDRGGYKYHGRVQELAVGAREGGLKF